MQLSKAVSTLLTGIAAGFSGILAAGCASTAPDVDESGTDVAPLVNGTKAADGQFPSALALKAKDQMCSAVRVGDRLILTASSCVASISAGEHVEVSASIQADKHWERVEVVKIGRRSPHQGDSQESTIARWPLTQIPYPEVALLLTRSGVRYVSNRPAGSPVAPAAMYIVGTGGERGGYAPAERQAAVKFSNAPLVQLDDVRGKSIFSDTELSQLEYYYLTAGATYDDRQAVTKIASVGLGDEGGPLYAYPLSPPGENFSSSLVVVGVHAPNQVYGLDKNLSRINLHVRIDIPSMHNWITHFAD